MPNAIFRQLVCEGYKREKYHNMTRKKKDREK